MSKLTLSFLSLLSLAACGASPMPTNTTAEPSAEAAPSESPPNSEEAGTLVAQADCTRLGCDTGGCCNACDLTLYYRPPNASPNDLTLLTGHSCRADGCGAVVECDLQPGPFTLPEGATRMGDGSIRLP